MLAGIQLTLGYQKIVDVCSNDCRDSDETGPLSSREVSEHRFNFPKELMSKTASESQLSYFGKEKRYK